jgi:beta-carotene hydroxylase
MAELQLPRTRSGFDLPLLADLGRDMTRLTKSQRGLTVALPFLCVLAFGIFAGMGWWAPATLAAGGYTFYSYGSTSHDLVHGNLGLPRWLNHTLLALVELLGLRSGHAYRAAHLHHHKRFPHPDDIEGAGAHRSWYGALLLGPLSQPRIWWWALRHARHDRAWIMVEGLGCVTFLAMAVCVCSMTPIPLVYLVLVVGGSWTFPVITPYLPHNPKGPDELTRTRRFRGKVAEVLFRQHLYHLEHHLYPKVPHHHWATLAQRLDPFLDRAGVKPIYFGF